MFFFLFEANPRIDLRVFEDKTIAYMIVYVFMHHAGEDRRLLRQT